jgi:hypothetical protein
MPSASECDLRIRGPHSSLGAAERGIAVADATSGVRSVPEEPSAVEALESAPIYESVLGRDAVRFRS